MPTHSINTAEANDHLVKSGMPATQAKAVVQTFAESHNLRTTKINLEYVRTEILSRFDGLKST